MSDGNINRALLPHGGYASGVRAGQAAERKRAVEALGRALGEVMPALGGPERDALIRRFKEIITER